MVVFPLFNSGFSTDIEDIKDVLQKGLGNASHSFFSLIPDNFKSEVFFLPFPSPFSPSPSSPFLWIHFRSHLFPFFFISKLAVSGCPSDAIKYLMDCANSLFISWQHLFLFLSFFFTKWIGWKKKKKKKRNIFLSFFLSLLIFCTMNTFLSLLHVRLGGLAPEQISKFDKKRIDLGFKRKRRSLSFEKELDG